MLSDISHRRSLPLGGCGATIVIEPQFVSGLQSLGEYSHLWVLAWLHLADCATLVPAARRANGFRPEYGVFALRSPGRPNPISLTSVELLEVTGNVLRVAGLDLIDGTPVLDLKPYNERDVVFSPCGPRFLPADEAGRRSRLTNQALTHHREDCDGLRYAVDVALVAETSLGPLEESDVIVDVTGPGCLADALQGITRARIANPPRFRYVPSETVVEVAFRRLDAVVRFGPHTVDGIFGYGSEQADDALWAEFAGLGGRRA